MAAMAAAISVRAFAVDLPTDLVPPKVISAPNPQYPAEAREQGIAGTVRLELLIGTDGKVRHVEVIRSLRADLDTHAVAAVRTWRFEPARLAGKPVAVIIQTSISFGQPIADGTESDSAASSAPSSAQVPRYLLAIRQSLPVGGLTSQMTCLTLYPDGRYDLERTSFDLRTHDSRTKIYEDLLPAAELEDVRHILNSPDLLNGRTEDIGNGYYVFREAEFTQVSIPREDRVQQLSSVSYFGVPGSVNNTAYKTDDKAHKLLKPLLDFVKNRIEKRKAKPVQGAASDCQIFFR